MKIKKVMCTVLLRYVVLLLSLLSPVLLSCSSRDNVRINIEQMLGSNVTIEEQKMEIWTHNYRKITNKNQSKQNTFLVYVDSTQCTPYFIKGLYEWNDLLKLDNSNKYSIEFLFIMQPRKGDTQMLRSKLDQSDFMHPVFIDKNGFFELSNPQISKEAHANVSEIYFYDALGKAIYSKVIGTKGSWGNNPSRMRQAAFDRDILTFCDALKILVEQGIIGVSLAIFTVVAILRNLYFFSKPLFAAALSHVAFSFSSYPFELFPYRTILVIFAVASPHHFNKYGFFLEIQSYAIVLIRISLPIPGDILFSS